MVQVRLGLLSVGCTSPQFPSATVCESTQKAC
jgi:hypothetical protein